MEYTNKYNYSIKNSYARQFSSIKSDVTGSTTTGEQIRVANHAG